MNQAKGTFTFRLDESDRAALERIATQMGCDRGAVLRRLIQQADHSLKREGCFMANSRWFRVKLVPRDGES